MPRIKNTQFTQDELNILRILVGRIGGDPIRSYRKHIDTLWNKLKVLAPRTPETHFISKQLNWDISDTGFPSFKDGFYEEDKC